MDPSSHSQRDTPQPGCLSTGDMSSSTENEAEYASLSVVIDKVCCIPPGHSWQDSLVLSLDSLHPTYTSEELSKEFIKWKNLNSFVARFTSTGFAPWVNLPIWQLRMALEEPPVKGSAMECWISHLQGYELDESTVRSLRTGPLCDDKPPLSVERWEFWKERFSELAADAGSLGLDSAITGRISDSLKSMDAVRE
ncbi:hypothetical protein B0J14DRAFT_635359 [Halenospora varia]|nr:hypothetical protein B0J14DRAFT_635359 [Halenospora varia]